MIKQHPSEWGARRRRLLQVLFEAVDFGLVVDNLVSDRDRGLRRTLHVLQGAVERGQNGLFVGRRARTAVTEVLRDGDRIAGVVLAGGEVVRAPVVVNAAGPWSPVLTRLVGAEADMRIHTAPMRQTSASCDAPEGFRVGDGGAVIADMDLSAGQREDQRGRRVSTVGCRADLGHGELADLHRITGRSAICCAMPSPDTEPAYARL
jgi:glycine/D-amino acid oxidase-like deaminating enzyme